MITGKKKHNNTAHADIVSIIYEIEYGICNAIWACGTMPAIWLYRYYCKDSFLFIEYCVECRSENGMEWSKCKPYTVGTYYVAAAGYSAGIWW